MGVDWDALMIPGMYRMLPPHPRNVPFIPNATALPADPYDREILWIQEGGDQTYTEWLAARR